MNPNYGDMTKVLVKDTPIIQAMLDLNILYKSKYYDCMHIEHSLYGELALKQYVADIKSQMSVREKLAYKYWKKTKDLVPLGKQYVGIPLLTRHSRRRGGIAWSNK